MRLVVLDKAEAIPSPRVSALSSAVNRSRGRGLFHRFLVWLCSRPERDRRPW